MIKGSVSFVVAVLLACAGCAEHKVAGPAVATPAQAPKSAPQPTSGDTAAPARTVAGTGSENRGGVSTTAVASPASPAAATGKAPAGEAPPATASAHVFSPQQTVSAAPSALPSASPQPSTTPAPTKAAVAVEPQGKDDASAKPTGELQLRIAVSAGQIAVGEVVTVDVMAASNVAVVDAPLHLSFGSGVLEFVDAAPGDFLTRGGSSVVFLADGLSRPGDVAIALGRVAREQGASGSGLLCRAHFRGVSAGTTAVSVGQVKAWGTAGEELKVRSAGTTVVVR